MTKHAGGWYVFTPRWDGVDIVHGGPYKSFKEAMGAIYKGLKITTVRGGTIAALDVRVEHWSAAEIKRYEKMIKFPKDAKPHERHRTMA